MSRQLLHTVILLASSTGALVTVVRADGPNVQAMRPDGTPNRAAWMARGTFGMMTHYLLQPKGKTQAEQTADLNRMVDQFDVDHYIRQFQETGADWLIFTLGQTTGYLCSPNATIDVKNPGHTPRRCS